MQNPKFKKLIKQAKERMRHSNDPIHDLAHVRRVVAHVKTLSRKAGMTEKQTQALELAAWWHDVSRTLTRHPSIVFMPIIDDILSALMLWHATIRCGMFGPVVGMATRMIACKNMGTHHLFVRLFIRKRNRIMVDLLEDADVLDVIDISRTKKLLALAESGKSYLLGYQIAAWWYFKKKNLQVKTAEAKEHLIELLEHFIEWIRQEDVRLWHELHFGKAWVKKFHERIVQTLKDLSPQAPLLLVPFEL